MITRVASPKQHLPKDMQQSMTEVLILKNFAFGPRPKLKPKVRSFVNFAFGTPSAALIVKWSASNIIS
jgi:hypothetical protein